MGGRGSTINGLSYVLHVQMKDMRNCAEHIRGVSFGRETGGGGRVGGGGRESGMYEKIKAWKALQAAKWGKSGVRFCAKGAARGFANTIKPGVTLSTEYCCNRER